MSLPLEEILDEFGISSPNMRLKDGSTVMHALFKEGRICDAHGILKAGRVDTSSFTAAPESETLLHYFARAGTCDVGIPTLLKDILAGGCDIDGTNGDGNTALHLACECGNLKVATSLVEAGANVDIQNKKEELALDKSFCYVRTSLTQEFERILEKREATIELATSTIEEGWGSISPIKEVESNPKAEASDAAEKIAPEISSFVNMFDQWQGDSVKKENEEETGAGLNASLMFSSYEKTKEEEKNTLKVVVDENAKEKELDPAASASDKHGHLNDFSSVSELFEYVARASGQNIEKFLKVIEKLEDNFYFTILQLKQDKKWTDLVPSALLPLISRELSEEEYGEGILMDADFKFKHEIGQGEFGSTYKDSYQGATVVVKNLHNQNPSQNEKEAFFKEATTMKDLRHPNIVQFMGISLNPICIVMEYVPNGDMETLLKKENIPAKDMVQMSKGAAAGMMYLHAHSVIHGDVAARNLLVRKELDKTYTVKVADFGLSNVYDSESDYVKISGKVPIAWCAPEILASKHSTSLSDVYAFGMTLYEIFEGKRPFSGTPVIKLMELIPVGARPKFEKTPAPIRKLIEDCWKQIPTERPSMNNVHERLEKIHAEMTSDSSKDVPDTEEEDTYTFL